MEITTNVKGQIAATKVELRALELGFIPSKPVFDTRYDLILDDGNKLLRVQIKYANAKPSYINGSVSVNLTYTNRKNEVYTYNQSEVDALIVYLPKLDKLCYLTPDLFIGKTRIYLRYLKSKNNQKKGIINVDDCLW